MLALVLLSTLSVWDRQKAFDYLEARQRAWAEWKPAQKAQGACVSCHTGLSYLMARRAAVETPASPALDALVEGVRKRITAQPPQTMLANEGAEAILSLLTLGLQRRDAAAPVTKADRVAMEMVWARQIDAGPGKGSWSWFMHDLHPVESEHSHFFAAVMADLALAAYPAEKPAKAAALQGYLKREFAEQPLHNKLAWAAFSGQRDAAGRTTVLKTLWAAQSADGGFTSASLGPWSLHDAAPPDTGSNAYATAWAAFTAQRAGAACEEPGLRRALDWLKQHQEASGAWRAPSMNKVYPAGSMQLGFMTDAATGYAAAALIACRAD